VEVEQIKGKVEEKGKEKEVGRGTDTGAESDFQMQNHSFGFLHMTAQNILSSLIVSRNSPC